MRITIPAHYRLSQTTPFVQLTGQNQENFVIQALEHDLIRVQHWPDGTPRLDRTWMVAGKEGDVPREGRQREDLSPFSLPEYQLRSEENSLELATKSLRLVATLENMALSWQTADGREFAADLLTRSYPYDKAGRAVFHYMQQRVDEYYYGFGERSGALVKNGRRMRMVNVDAMAYNAAASDPLYKHYPFYITYIPGLEIAYGLFYDNFSTVTFDMGSEIDAFHGYYRYYQAEDGDIDYYLIYGPSIPEVVQKFIRLTGQTHLPPRWSLGYLASTMSYTEAADAQQQLENFITLCDQHDIPCDMFHMSSGYTTDERGTRYVFTWNRDKFPNPQQMSEKFHQAGIHLTANVKPYFLQSHPLYNELKKRKGFIQAAEADEPEIGRFWSGGAFESGLGGYVDFTNPAAYEWWQQQLKQQLLEYGIDGIWNDNNEFQIWDDAARCNGFGKEMPMGVSRPILTLLMVKAAYEIQKSHAPDVRPFVLSRAGCPGIQRYAQSWSGDNHTSWETLRYNIPMGLGMSLSGFFNTGHDVGGFAGPKPSPELFVRWLQNGIFHPRFTIHSWNEDRSVNEPWMYPEMLPLVREIMQFRYRLIPYLYTLIFEAVRQGIPVIRPMVYAFPDDPHCWTESFDFMLGDHLLVASVLEAGARTRDVYLPGGGEWCDFHTGKWYQGGNTITVDAPLDRIPLFVPSGGMIPLGKVMRHVGEQPDDYREVLLFPRTGQGHLTLIEDDGISVNAAFTEIHMTVLGGEHDITLDMRVSGSYSLPYKNLVFILPPGEKRPLKSQHVLSADIDSLGRQVVLCKLP
ncbi:MAG: glycoside hydrolase family 31 protein [Anaerolineae bacterium]|nr:MAG: glycoside hydrolase family 31 protein [Anaerolineae bacterium]